MGETIAKIYLGKEEKYASSKNGNSAEWSVNIYGLKINEYFHIFRGYWPELPAEYFARDMKEKGIKHYRIMNKKELHKDLMITETNYVVPIKHVRRFKKNLEAKLR